jgi:hypothetical protein
MQLSGEMALLAVIGIALVGGIGREVYGFVRWKRQLSRMDAREWARVVQLLRK